MLATSQNERAYAKPKLNGRRPPGTEQLARKLTPIIGNPKDSLLSASENAEFDLGALFDRRAQLAFQKLSGGKLSLVEHIQLRLLNALLSTRIPVARQLPPDAEELIAEAKRLRR